MALHFPDFLAKYAGEACALRRATRDYEAAYRDFVAWERQRLQQVTPR